MNLKYKTKVPRSKNSSEKIGSTSESWQLVDHFFRSEYAKLVATLTGKFGVRNWETVEDVVQSSLERALNSWSRNGIPDNPSAWLYRAASNLAIDTLRRDSRRKELNESHDFRMETQSSGFSNSEFDDSNVQDDLLRMIFLCCNPQVPPESQIALSLKTLCGFGNCEIARALLTTEASVAKRITRAKQRLRELNIEPAKLGDVAFRERLSDIQSVIYLLFNEGYSSSVAEKLIREELCEEAVRMALILAEHPATAGPESSAFLSLLLFHSSRLNSRIDENGAMRLLKEQDRSLWDKDLIEAAFFWFRKASGGETLTRYHAEAWIASEHCRASSIDETNWERIAQGYELLCTIAPSPVHEINRAIAIGHRDGPQEGLKLFNKIDSDSFGQDYYLWHATKAELARQTGDQETARNALQAAWKLAPTNAEKELICRKLDQLSK